LAETWTEVWGEIENKVGTLAQKKIFWPKSHRLTVMNVFATDEILL